MSFFQQQDKARKKTGLLVFYFILAIALIVLVVDAALVVSMVGVDQATMATRPGDLALAILIGTLGTLGVIGAGSFWKMRALASGGAAVAEMMGGQRVFGNTKDPLHRRLLNVVEEMALASGIAVPAVYVLPAEGAINAFAAGNTPSTAAVAVSQGALSVLSRDELQGVVAHEFSHIFNGDMRINLRLIGLLHGILLLAIGGRLILHGGRFGRLRSRNNKDAGGVALLGISLLVIGSIGVFFARLIKSAISRQREYLADASAVQFTRNPHGIRGALIKIRDGAGATLTSAHADEVSHLLFAEGLSSWFATHPPIDARIAAIDGTAPSLTERAVAAPRARPAPDGASGFAPSMALAAVGEPKERDLAAAKELLGNIPATLREQACTAEGARAIVYALLLARDAKTRELQAQLLEGERELTWQTAAVVRPLGSAARLPLAQLAVTALRTMSAAARDEFLAKLARLGAADGKLEPFELMLEVFMRCALLEEHETTSARRGTLAAALPEARALLSLLARVGDGRAAEAERAFAAGVVQLGGSAQLVPARELSSKRVHAALGALRASPFRVREQVMRAAAACVLADAKVTIDEWELLRVFAAVLECPLPFSMQAKEAA